MSTVRTTKDTHKKLRALAYMQNVSMATVLDMLVNSYVDTNMDVHEQENMWQVMSATVTRARNKGEK